MMSWVHAGPETTSHKKKLSLLWFSKLVTGCPSKMFSCWSLCRWRGLWVIRFMTWWGPQPDNFLRYSGPKRGSYNHRRWSLENLAHWTCKNSSNEPLNKNVSSGNLSSLIFLKPLYRAGGHQSRQRLTSGSGHLWWSSALESLQVQKGNLLVQLKPCMHAWHPSLGGLRGSDCSSVRNEKNQVSLVPRK